MKALDKKHYFTTLGPVSEGYTSKGAAFTEVVVFDEDKQQLAHFVGPFAKRNAWLFVKALKEKDKNIETILKNF